MVLAIPRCRSFYSGGGGGMNFTIWMGILFHRLYSSKYYKGPAPDSCYTVTLDTLLVLCTLAINIEGH